jgi:hypothetical protein
MFRSRMAQEDGRRVPVVMCAHPYNNRLIPALSAWTEKGPGGTMSSSRLWRSVKYEGVYLGAHDGVGEARSSIGRYLYFYVRRRPHSSLDGTTPDQAYFIPLPFRLAAQPRQRLHLSRRKSVQTTGTTSPR